jgi:hypothetical protein
VLPSAQLQISRLCSAKDGAASARRTCAVASLHLVMDARRFGALQRISDVSATTKHVRSALRMREVDRPQRWPATSRPFTFQSQPEGKK